MERLLQAFDTPYTDGSGDVYDVHLYGRSRAHDTWQGWIVFTRRRDGRTFPTGVETTQPSAEAVLYWATGLTDPYFDGAFERAARPASSPALAEPPPPPLRDPHAGRLTYLRRLSHLERDILRSFDAHATRELPTQALLDELPHTHADVVRALEDLEKRHRVIERRTEGGSDWVILRQ